MNEEDKRMFLALVKGKDVSEITLLKVLNVLNFILLFA